MSWSTEPWDQVSNPSAGSAFILELDCPWTIRVGLSLDYPVHLSRNLTSASKGSSPAIKLYSNGTNLKCRGYLTSNLIFLPKARKALVIRKYSGLLILNFLFAGLDGGQRQKGPDQFPEAVGHQMSAGVRKGSLLSISLQGLSSFRADKYLCFPNLAFISALAFIWRG